MNWLLWIEYGSSMDTASVGVLQVAVGDLILVQNTDQRYDRRESMSKHPLKYAHRVCRTNQARSKATQTG